MLQILHRSRHHRYDNTGGLKLITSDADRVIAFLTRKCRVHDRGLGAEALGLGAFRLHAVAVTHIHEHRNHQQEVILIVVSRRLIRRCGHMDLHQSGGTRKFFGIRRDTI